MSRTSTLEISSLTLVRSRVASNRGWKKTLPPVTVERMPVPSPRLSRFLTKGPEGTYRRKQHRCTALGIRTYLPPRLPLPVPRLYSAKTVLRESRATFPFPCRTGGDLPATSKLRDPNLVATRGRCRVVRHSQTENIRVNDSLLAECIRLTNPASAPLTAAPKATSPYCVS